MDFGLNARVKALKQNWFKKGKDIDVAAPAPGNKVPRLEIPLEEIKSATGNFSEANLIGEGGFGKVYKGQLSHHGGNTVVAVKRLDSESTQGWREFKTEILMLSNYRHSNLISLIGYCEEDSEMILIYEYAQHGSLDKALRGENGRRYLTWEDRLNIAIGAASGLNYLHGGVGLGHRIIHRDVKSANILLGDNWVAKISDFGLSKVGLANQASSFMATNPAGTWVYCDPEYIKTNILTKGSDVYSFGVVLFEILSGKPAMIIGENNERESLIPLVHRCFKGKRFEDIVDPYLREQKLASKSLEIYTTIAYQCLSETSEERPTMELVVQQLRHALKCQREGNDEKFSRKCLKIAGGVVVGAIAVAVVL